MMEENTRMSQAPRRIQVPAPESLKDCAAFLDTYRLEALRPMFSQVRAALPYCQWTVRAAFAADPDEQGGNWQGGSGFRDRLFLE